MRLIDADALGLDINRKAHENFPANRNLTLYAESLLAHAPTIDAVPVVRCKDCKYSRGLNEKERLCVCDNALICKNSEAHVDGWSPMWPNDYCSYGERKDGD